MDKLKAGGSSEAVDLRKTIEARNSELSQKAEKVDQLSEVLEARTAEIGAIREEVAVLFPWLKKR